METIQLPDPLSLIGILIFLSLAPFVVIMITSYVKLVVVMSLIRNALGTQNIPPNMVINGLAIILSIYIMTPVVTDVYDVLRKETLTDLSTFPAVIKKAEEPIRDFLLKHSNPEERRFFMESARVVWPKDRAKDLKDTDLLVLIPSFTVGELTQAFQIGFLLYLPFVAVDLIVSNILLAMGMMMVSPMTISLPFKLLLFVIINGWTRLVHGLILSYS